MIILGAGLSGLIAGNMLRRFKTVIYEAQPSLPNNHAALLRFRTDTVSNACAVPFKKVKVHKAVYYNSTLSLEDPPDIEIMNKYAHKVTGKYCSRSIKDLKTVERYISPANFIEQASQQLDITYDKEISAADLEQRKKAFEPGACYHSGERDPAISTIPMDKMMDMVDWKNKPDFQYSGIITTTCKVSLAEDLYQTIYFPGGERYYRCSITGDQLIVEQNNHEDPDSLDLHKVLHFFGINSPIENRIVKHQKYGKLLPIDDRLRKEFMLYLTKEYGIYSLGRFATWRQILLDDVVQDVNVIERLMNSSNYEISKHASAT